MSLAVQQLYKSEYKIWKILFDETGKYAIVEVRNEELREAFLVAINWQSGKLIWDEGYLEEEWWFSLAGVAEGRLFAHLLHDEQEPSPKALLALDIEEAEGLWQLADATLLSLAKGAVQTEQQGKEVLVAAATGEPLHGVKEAEAIQNSWLLPSRYLEGEEYFATVASYLESRGKRPAGVIDYWEGGNFICVGYYQIEGVYYDNYLLIIDRMGEERLLVKLNSGAKGVGTESFGIQGGDLFYIRNKTVLEKVSLV